MIFVENRYKHVLNTPKNVCFKIVNSNVENSIAQKTIPVIKSNKVVTIKGYKKL